MNSLHVFFKVFPLFMTWEDCFYKLKLLLAANTLIYLNISISISKVHGPRPPHAIVFLHSLTTSAETTSRDLFQRGKLCENNCNLRK